MVNDAKAVSGRLNQAAGLGSSLLNKGKSLWSGPLKTTFSGGAEHSSVDCLWGERREKSERLSCPYPLCKCHSYQLNPEPVGSHFYGPTIGM